MINKFSLVIISFFISYSSFSQSTKSIIKEIKNNYKEVVKNKDFIIEKFQNLIGRSSEGGQAIAFFEENSIRLIDISWLGEMGKTSRSYYFKNKQLFFIFEQIFTYNAPIYYDKEAAKENNSIDFFDDNKTVISENRYYIKDNKLIKWLDENKKQKQLNNENIELVNRLIKEILAIKKGFKN